MAMDIVLHTGYILLLVAILVIRYPHEKRNAQNTINSNQKTTLEKILLFAVSLGMMFIPLLHVFFNLYSFANYTVPFFVNILGLILILPTLWLFYRSHKDLGRNWSVSLELRKRHTIVDSGVYTYVRHPMYSAIWLWCLVQALLLNNYIAGLSGLLSFAVLYFLRVKKEEAMMIAEFGQKYRKYMKKTKRIIPYLW